VKKTALWISISIVIFILIYFGISIALIIGGKPKKQAPKKSNLAFKELRIDYKNIPMLKTFTARDGKQLAYRYYPAQSDKAIILLHGSGWHSRYFLPLASFISSEGLARVYTPDLRGHGHTPDRRGDVDYIGQLDDDLADFIAMIRKENPKTVLIVGGHSSGGGLAIRFAGSKYGQQADAYMLLSPYLQYNAPTIRPYSGGWARPYTGRIIGITMLNNIGIKWFNGMTVIDFNMPEEVRDGTETLSYSYRLSASFSPYNYKKDLSAISKPLFVAAGTADEAFFADKFEPAISQFAKVKVRLLKDVTHMGVVVGPEIRPVIKEWLESLDKK
jgi:non-heme chloroperoxidase